MKDRTDDLREGAVVTVTESMSDTFVELECEREEYEILSTQIEDLEMQCSALQEYNREIEESRDHYATLIDNAPVGHLLLDAEGVITDANLTIATILGLEKEKMIGLPFSTLVVKADNEIFFNHIKHCKTAKTRVCTEFEMKSSCCERFCAKVVSFPFSLLDHQTFYYNTAIIDVSNQKCLEEEIQRLDRLNLIGEMAAGIAHEMRNPMTIVRGYLQLYERRSTNQQELENIKLMLEELDRANAIITEFLVLGKNKTNKLVMKNVNQIIEAIYPLVQAEALLGDKAIVLKLFSELPEVLIDGKEIRQLLLNLVNNALQSMDQGRVTIYSFQEQEDVVIAVADQGCGIPDEIQNKIGTPFFTTKDKGTGLGMAICYSIVQRHNAKLNFKTSSAGTTFFIRFPLPKKLL